MQSMSQMPRAAFALAQYHPPLVSSGSTIVASLLEEAPLDTKGGTRSDGDSLEVRIPALVDLAREGDAEAFGQLYDHYVSRVFRFAYSRSGSWHLAEDLTSETFARALRSIATFQWKGRDFGAWLTTITRNLVADHFKSSRQRHELSSSELPESRIGPTGPADEVIAEMTGELVMSAVRALPEQQRDCLLMRFVQGMSVAQTAEVLGRSEGATRQLQLRSVRKLADDLRKEVLG